MLALEYRGIITSSLTILDLSWHDNKACGKKSCQVVGRRRCCCLPFDRRCFMWNKERFVKLGFKIQVHFYQKKCTLSFQLPPKCKMDYCALKTKVYLFFFVKWVLNIQELAKVGRKEIYVPQLQFSPPASRKPIWNHF